LRRSTAAALAEVAAALPRTGANDGNAFTPAVTRQAGASIAAAGRTAPVQRRNADDNGQAARDGASSRTGKKETAVRARRTPTETVALAARIKAERPSLTEAEIAAELGISPSRWRTVRREAAQAADHTLAA
jgi:hypothetical protein